VPDELTTTLELPACAQALSRAERAYRRFAYEVRHPENHKQLVRFLCVGVSGYVVNLATFALCIHGLKLADAPSLIIAFLVGSTNNFVWNRHWTFAAKEEHPFRQGLRFFAVSTLVFFFATGIYDVLVHGVGIHEKVMADGIAWVIATPLSFVVQKLWSFKA
jgi:putative flippase GtrA